MTQTQTLTTALKFTNALARHVHLLGLFINILATSLILYFAMHPSFYYMEWVIYLAAQICLAAISYVAFLLTSSLTGNLRKQTQFHRRHCHWQYLFLSLIAVWTAIAFQLPLRLAFLTIKPALERTISIPGVFTNGIPNDIAGPFHRISAETTNRNLRDYREENINTGMLLFRLAEDGEAAFIYSTNGIANLYWNSGTCGHLIGNWYWMKED